MAGGLGRTAGEEQNPEGAAAEGDDEDPSKAKKKAKVSGNAAQRYSK